MTTPVTQDNTYDAVTLWYNPESFNQPIGHWIMEYRLIISYNHNFFFINIKISSNIMNDSDYYNQMSLHFIIQEVTRNDIRRRILLVDYKLQ